MNRHCLVCKDANGEMTAIYDGNENFVGHAHDSCSPRCTKCKKRIYDAEIIEIVDNETFRISWNHRHCGGVEVGNKTNLRCLKCGKKIHNPNMIQVDRNNENRLNFHVNCYYEELQGD